MQRRGRRESCVPEDCGDEVVVGVDMADAEGEERSLASLGMTGFGLG